MSELDEGADGKHRRADDRALRDFATVAAGYIAGHGVLRLFAGLLVGVGDVPRAELIWRWLPLWNALGWFVGAWGLYRIILWTGRWSCADILGPRNTANSWPEPRPAPPAETSARREERRDSTTTMAPRPEPPPDWKERLKGMQKRKAVDAILDFRQELARTLPKARVAQLDRRLGKWFTKHFQHVMLGGRAAESLADVERVAAHYAGSEEFAYFQAILPVVRQCAAIKQPLRDEE